MNIAQLIAAGKWAEKIDTGTAIIESSDPTFAELKAKFLTGAKETAKWRLVSYMKESSQDDLEEQPPHDYTQ